MLDQDDTFIPKTQNTASHALVEVTSAESKSVTSIDNILLILGQ